MSEKLDKILQLQEEGLNIKEIAIKLESSDKVIRNLLRRNGYKAIDGVYVKSDDIPNDNTSTNNDAPATSNIEPTIETVIETKPKSKTINTKEQQVMKFMIDNFEQFKTLLEGTKESKVEDEHKQPHFYNDCVAVSLKINKDVYERFNDFTKANDGLGKKDWLSYLVEIGLDEIDKRED